MDDAYVRYLTSHSQGRLATIGPDSGPQNKPVGYRYNAGLETIDIGGFNNERSAKYRNVGRDPNVAFVIDDAIGEGAENMRFLEIRGRAEQAGELIRIHPRRLVSWNVDPSRPGLHTSDVRAGTASQPPVSQPPVSQPPVSQPPVSEPSGQPTRPGRPALDLGDGATLEAEHAAQALAAELQAGFEAKDADVSNRHFAADIAWGSPFGATVHGYDDLHAIHVWLKKQDRGGTRSRFEVVTVLAPAPGVAVAQIRRTALDDQGRAVEPSGDLTKAFSEMALYVLVRRGGTWWLAAGQNTPVLPPPDRG
jgi:PPOX class F420-dependent enzyme/OxyR family protein